MSRRFAEVFPVVWSDVALVQAGLFELEHGPRGTSFEREGSGTRACPWIGVGTFAGQSRAAARTNWSESAYGMLRTKVEMAKENAVGAP